MVLFTCPFYCKKKLTTSKVEVKAGNLLFKTSKTCINSHPTPESRRGPSLLIGLPTDRFETTGINALAYSFML